MSIEQNLDSKNAALLLRNLADVLEKSNDRSLAVGDGLIKLPLDLDIQLEYEQEEDDAELEIELKWQLPKEDGDKKKRAPKFEIFQGKDDQWYFHLKAANNEIILGSEGYKRKEGAQKGVESVKTNADPANIQYRNSRLNQPYFVLRARNHEIIGVSQMYKRRASAEKGAASVIQNAPKAEIL